MPVFSYEKGTSYFELVVPTSNLMCYSYLIEKYIDIKSHIFLTGVSGSGKTVIAESTLRKLNETVLDIRMSFSSQTSSQAVQIQLESKLQT
jgi:dynein heavy chain